MGHGRKKPLHFGVNPDRVMLGSVRIGLCWRPYAEFVGVV